MLVNRHHIRKSAKASSHRQAMSKIIRYDCYAATVVDRSHSSGIVSEAAG